MVRPALRLRNWTPARVKQTSALWASGLSAGQIAKRLDCSRSAVCAKLQRLGLHRGHKPPTAHPVIVTPPKRVAVVALVPSPSPAPDPLHRPVPQPRRSYTKTELRAMLAEAAANTARIIWLNNKPPHLKIVNQD